MAKTPEIGDLVRYAGKVWMVVDVHGYPVRTLDLRHTVVIDPKHRYKDEAISKRGVPVSEVTP